MNERRKEYATQATARMLQREPLYTTGLKFDVQQGGTADADHPKPEPVMKEPVSA